MHEPNLQRKAETLGPISKPSKLAMRGRHLIIWGRKERSQERVEGKGRSWAGSTGIGRLCKFGIQSFQWGSHPKCKTLLVPPACASYLALQLHLAKCWAPQYSQQNDVAPYGCTQHQKSSRPEPPDSSGHTLHISRLPQESPADFAFTSMTVQRLFTANHQY